MKIMKLEYELIKTLAFGVECVKTENVLSGMSFDRYYTPNYG